MGDVTRAYLENISRGIDPAEPDLSFENIRDKLSLRLVETKRNREYLLDKPHLDVGNGLALICDLQLSRNMSECWRTVVNNGIAEANGYDKNELFQEAIRSAVKEQAADILGEGYTVLPSSLHEVLLVPDSSQIPVRDLQNMVKETNRSQVEPKDILSDNIYHFDNFQGKLSTIQLERGKEAR